MEQCESNYSALPHQLLLHQRHSLDLDGITEVEHFDELTIVVDTTMGELTIIGNNLHIQQLNLEDGRLSIEGKVNGITYQDKRKRTGFLGRILR